MVHGSWLMAQGGPGAEAGGGVGVGGGRPPRGPLEPWTMSHEPLTIDKRLINQLFDSRL